MTKLGEYREFLQSVRSSVGYWKSYSLLQFTLSLTRLMKRKKVSGKALGKLLEVSPQQVSKVLRGNENVTIETMAKYALALDAVVHIHVAKRGVKVDWVERELAIPKRGVEAVSISVPWPVRDVDFNAESYAPASGKMAIVRGVSQDNPVPAIQIN